MRIDKFLWCVRLCKSRSMATDACDRGQVQLNGHAAKPSREVKVGDAFSVRVPPIQRTYRVIHLPTSRVGAKLVNGFMEETTTHNDLEKLDTARKVRAAHRDPGSGRPTKRDRRDMDRFVRE